MPLFSVVFGYRNREPQRVFRCLQSLAKQSFNDFEVIFVDYGSEAETAKQVKNIVQSFSFCTYVYNETRGYPWNRSHALNTGIRQANGTYIITTDIDLIFNPTFFEKLVQKVRPDKLINAKTYYLPASFTQYDDVFELSESFISGLPIADETALGLFQVVKATTIKEINAFDEFYRIWGFEDLDVNRRLLARGLTMEWLNLNEFPVYHQWHPSSNALLPKGWFKVMQEYYLSEQTPSSDNWGRIYTMEERPALQKKLASAFDVLPKLTIHFPKAYAFSYQLPEWLTSGKSFYVDFNEECRKQAGKKAMLVSKANKVLSTFISNVNLALIPSTEEDVPMVEEVRDHLFYALLRLDRNTEVDYYYQYSEKNLLLIYLKK